MTRSAHRALVPRALAPAWRAFLVLALVAGLAACTPAEREEAAAPEPSGEVVARIDGEPIRASELEDWLRDDLYEEAVRDKDAAGLHAFRREGLERMISAELLEAETERRGVEIAELHAATVGDASVDETEVVAFYEENRARMGGQPLEVMAPRIRGYLEQRAESEAWSAFLSDLRNDAAVELLIEPPRLDVAAVGPAKGPENAPVTIVEFSDFNCPYCQRVTPTLDELHARYPDRVRLVFRHFPLDMHPRARAIAEASVCAAEQDGFWDFHDAVFETGEPLSDEQIREMASEVGLDVAALEGCLETGRAAEAVDRDLADGAAAGVTGTPAFFVNGIPLRGARDADQLARVIDAELARLEADD